MGFVISRAAVGASHGVFALEASIPPVIEAAGTGVVGLVGRFPWGPDNEVIRPPTPADRIRTLAPYGMSQTGTGYMAIFNKVWPDLRLVRALGSAAAQATKTITDGLSAPADIITVTAKYKGAAGNDIDIVIENATDGVGTHFNMRALVTGESGTTEELYENIDANSGTPVLPDLSGSILLQSPLVVDNAGRPANGSYDLATGADGTINDARYLGTLGAPDYGLSLLEGDPEVRIVLSDDCGDTDRAAVNAGLVAHQAALGDRMVLLGGNSGLSLSGVQAAKAAVSAAVFAIWVDCWTYQNDPLGVERLVPPAPWMATVMANLSPSTSPALKGQQARALLANLLRLETPRGGAGAASNTKLGISTLIKKGGGHVFEAAVVTYASVEPAKKRVTRSRMGLYIASSLTDSLQGVGDAPNVPVIRQEILSAIQRFMEGLKAARDTDPLNTPHIIDWAFGDIATANPQADLDNGIFTVPISIKTSSGLEQIFLVLKYGENISVTLQEAA